MNKYWLFLIIFMAACQKPVEPAGKESRVKDVVQSQPRFASAEIGNRSAEEMVAAGFRRYGIEQGILIFRLDGAVNGMEMLFFDHWGWREAKYIMTESDIGAYDEKTNTVQYLDGEKRYEYDPGRRTAHYFSSAQVQRSSETYGTKDMVEVGMEMIRKMGGTPAGHGDVQGVSCEIWELDRYDTRLWMWQGITMREKSKAANLPVSRICISLKTEEEIPEEKLVLPAGVKVVKMEN